MKVSIIIPTYNRATLIERALNSIKEQSYTNWECLVVDDHSTDNTKEVVANYCNNDKRYKYLTNNRKKGAPGSRNTGLLEATGDYVVFFDSDNKMHPSFLQELCKVALNENVEVVGCYSNVIDSITGALVDKFDKDGYGDVHEKLWRGKCYFDNSSTLIKRDMMISIGLLDEDCPSYQEYDTHIRLSKICKYYTVRKELVDYYSGGRDTISKSEERAVQGELYILQKYKKELINDYTLCFFIKGLSALSRILSLNDSALYEQPYDYLCRFKGIVGSFYYIFRLFYPIWNLIIRFKIWRYK